MTPALLAAALAAAALAYLAFALARLGFAQRLALLVRIPADLSGVLQQASRRYGARPLISLQHPLDWAGPGSDQWSARQVEDSCARLAAVWSLLEVRHNERLALYKANQFDLFLFSASAIRAGAIAAPVNGDLAPAVAARYLESIGARVLVTDLAGYTRLFQNPGVEPPASVGKVVITDAPAAHGRANPAQTLSLPALLALGLPPVAPQPRGADDPVYLVHTSGTTGVPKGVILHSRALVEALRSALLLNFVSRRDTALLAVPLSHQVAQLYLYGMLMMGLPCVLNLDGDPRSILDTLARRRPSLFFAFPSTYTRLTAHGSDACRFDSVRIWATIGDASHAVHQRAFRAKGRFFRDLGIPLPGALFIAGLGSSEVGIAALLRIVTPWTARFGRRVGRGTPLGPRLKIVDAAGAPVARGTAGRLMIKGPCLFAGYWNAHGTLFGASRDGWWFTGDLVRRERDGELSHLDREEDAMHTRLGIVHTLPIEEAVLCAPGVLEVSVFGLRDEQGFDLPAAVLALRPDAPRLPPSILLAGLNAQLAPREQLLFLWVIGLDDFPLGATGKTLKRCLRETYSEIARIGSRQHRLAPHAGRQTV
ncbi:class I adenylate-forming enzyme family protein [Massilia glaciei]|uniref:class I adenylate-forming enzyme family protein n=1 Tax=Massilia glaciei TaxID=1524097 RepID=UPI0015E801DD|nr:class I adenylate-forming enzyme family protein [Massilia glaciei]